MSKEFEIKFESALVRETNIQTNRKTAVEAISQVIADIENVEPTDLPPLYEYVDPDAVNRLVTYSDNNDDSTTGLWFTYRGWTIFVRDDGALIVADSDKITGPPLF